MENNRLDDLFNSRLRSKVFKPDESDISQLAQLLRKEAAAHRKAKKRRVFLLLLLLLITSSIIYLFDKSYNQVVSKPNAIYPNMSVDVLETEFDFTVGPSAPQVNSQVVVHSSKTVESNEQRVSIATTSIFESKNIIQNEEVKNDLAMKSQPPSYFDIDTQKEDGYAEINQMGLGNSMLVEKLPALDFSIIYPFSQIDQSVNSFEKRPFIANKRKIWTLEGYYGRPVSGLPQYAGLNLMVTLTKLGKWSLLGGVSYEHTLYNDLLIRGESYDIFSFDAVNEQLLLRLQNVQRLQVPLRIAYQIKERNHLQGTLVISHLLGARGSIEDTAQPNRSSIWIVDDYFHQWQLGIQLHYIREFRDFAVGGGLRWQKEPLRIRQTNHEATRSNPLTIEVKIAKQF